MGKFLFYILLPGLPFFFSGCNFPTTHTDLTDYIAETKRRPSGQIEPLPVFKPHGTFTYGAMRLRSPFDPPVAVEMQVKNSGNQSLVAPDVNRPREVLENFNFNDLVMVGSVKKGGVVWALINAEGVIHKIRQGNYMGKNHGKVKALSDMKIDVVEIVADGAGGWLERPRTIELNK